MTLSRLAAWTLLAAAGFALINRAASAQDSPIPVQSGEALDAMVTYKDSASRGIPTAELPAARKQFLRFAKYYGDVVQHPLVYKHLQDPSTKDPGGRTIPTFEGQGESVFTQLNRFVVEPTPRSGITKDRGDYIREFGAAFDTVLKPIINENPEKIVRINATRILAAVCKSGATAFYPTVTELLKSANTPTYIKYYALVAARNLLAAYDVYDYRSRRHSNGWKNVQSKGAGDKELAELVVAIQKLIEDPAAIMTYVPNFKLDEATPDQVEVIQFIRRQAVRRWARSASWCFRGRTATRPSIPPTRWHASASPIRRWASLPRHRNSPRRQSASVTCRPFVIPTCGRITTWIPPLKR